MVDAGNDPSPDNPDIDRRLLPIFGCRSHDERIGRAVRECGAVPHWIDAYHELATLPSCHQASVALVCLRASAGPDIALDVVRTLKLTGCTIIGFGEGTETWPLGVRCRGLLAGATCLLDSGRSTFAQELARLLSELIENAARRRRDDQTLQATMKRLGLVGKSPVMLAVFQAIVQASSLSDLPVLVTGETGTGKELVARAIHSLDLKRCGGPFLPFNSSALSPSLAESELFGHRRGAFTGADRERRGLFRAAHGGTLFLDEIGELDSALQAKLLRVLQDYRVMAVGDDHEVGVNVRIVAATNRDLNEMIRQSRFRADLFHRLNVLAVHIPPLRERRDDIGPLTEHLLEKHRRLRPECAVTIGPDFLEAVTRIELPGNGRQLENLVRYVLINKHDASPLSLADLPEEVWQQLAAEGRGPDDPSPAGQDPNTESRPEHFTGHLENLLAVNGWNLSRALEDCERSFLQVALHAANNNQSRTARLLGLTPRSVYNKIRRYGLRG